MAVVAGDGVASLALETGDTRWLYPVDGSILDLCADDAGPIIAHARQEQTVLIALNWEGDVRWRIEAGIAMAGQSLLSLGTHLLARGVHLTPRVRQVCRVIDAASGAIVAEHPVVGVGRLDAVLRGIVSSDHASGPEQTGLWLYDVGARQTVRLHDAPHDVRVVVDRIAVIDTFVMDNKPAHGELLAIDTTSGRLIWSAAGGPNLTLAADTHDVASVMAQADNSFVATLRELASGRVHWQSERILGREATVMLAADAVLVSVDGKQLLGFDRARGALIQTLDERSTLVYGACFARGGLVDVCGREVRFLRSRQGS